MKLSLKELENILAGMLETVYSADYSSPETMQPIVEEQKNYISSLPEQERLEHDRSLKQTMRYILNNGQAIDYNEFLFSRIERDFNDQEEARRLFILIWNIFFPGEDFNAPQLTNTDAEVTDIMGRPFEWPLL